VSGACDEDLWGRVGELGWLGIAVPERYGGAGATYAEVGLVLEEVGRVLALIPFAAQSAAIQTILSLGTPTQCEELLPDLVAGSKRVAVALQGHRDALHAKPMGGRSFLLSGSTAVALGTGTAQLFVVSAITESGPGLFVADVDETTKVNGNRPLDLRRDMGTVTFEGTPATGLGDLTNSVAVETALALMAITIACESAGATARCLEQIVEYLKVREQFGRPIGAFQALKHRCATLFVESNAATAAARLAAHEVGGDSTALVLAAAVAKMACSPALLLAAMESIQMHGAIGFSWEFDAHLYLRRAKSDEHLYGTTWDHGIKVADSLSAGWSDSLNLADSPHCESF